MAVHELFPSLRVADAAAAIEFYRRVFEARELFRLTEPSGRIGHVELDFNGTVLMLSDEFPEYGMLAPQAGAPLPFALHLHVDDADAVVARALEHGATLEMPLKDHFYGERSGMIRDPFGHGWSIGHSLETVSPEEMQRRYTRLCEEGGEA